MNRENSRRSDFKKGLDAVEGRRRRTETTISLRKDKKSEGLAKRRAMSTSPVPPAAAAAADSAMKSEGAIAVDSSKKKYTAADIPALAAALRQPGIPDATLLDVVRGFRKIMSLEHNPPVEEVLASGVLPAFVQMLALHDKPMVQFEAAWALTNIASTEETQAVVDAGAVPHFAQLLASPSAEVREQCAWCLGNVAGDSAALRDVVLASGALPTLLQNIAQPDNDSLFGNCVWALSNFCRGKPAPPLRLVAPALPTLVQVLKSDKSADAKSDALWALSYISDGDDDRIQAVLDADPTMASVLIGLLDGESTLATPALRTVGNIVSGNDDQTQAIVEAGFMGRIGALLHAPKRMLRKEACWVISNIAAGTHEQIGKVLKTKGCTQRVIEMATSSEWEVRKEAIWVISNIVTGGTDRQVMSVVEAGAIDAICSVLNVNDSKMLLVALDALDHILKLGARTNKAYESFVDECDGLDMIEALQEHESEEVYEKAVHLIETYFGAEDGEEDENIAPEVNGGTFSFGVPQQKMGEVDPAAGGSAQPFTTFNFAAV